MDAEASRTDYAPSEPCGGRGACLKAVEKGSPAYQAGLRPGMMLTQVDGSALRDLIDWYWLSADSQIVICGVVPEGVVDGDGDRGPFEFEVDIEREPGRSWGIEFEDCVFDGMRLCRNACLFCFMSMLPAGLRPALYLRDDDYRLSFLQGNFVTLTNLDEADVERIIAQHISPLHVSVHAVDHAVRSVLLGAHESRGLEALDILLAAGIECHTQIVLVPGLDDGDVLIETLGWLEARPGVLSCSIVPLGYTRYQTRFDSSYETPRLAREVIGLVRPFQERARAELGITRFHLADEFYLNAALELPPAADYDGYGQFEDGIGMVRSFLEEWSGYWEGGGVQVLDADALERAVRSGRGVHLITGEAFAPILRGCVEASVLSERIHVTGVHNAFFGGDVDVTGLLCGCDLVAAIRTLDEDGFPESRLYVPDVVFNADGLTLDDYTIGDIARESERPVYVLSCNIEAMMAEVIGYLIEET